MNASAGDATLVQSASVIHYYATRAGCHGRKPGPERKLSCCEPNKSQIQGRLRPVDGGWIIHPFRLPYNPPLT